MRNGIWSASLIVGHFIQEVYTINSSLLYPSSRFYIALDQIVNVAGIPLASRGSQRPPCGMALILDHIYYLFIIKHILQYRCTEMISWLSFVGLG